MLVAMRPRGCAGERQQREGAKFQDGFQRCSP
jgi:hypothetical protein